MGSHPPEPLPERCAAREPATAFPSLPGTSKGPRAAELRRIPLLQQDVV